MPRVYLGLGSNIEREQHIRAALKALEDAFGLLLISPVYESESVGFAGSNFFNLVVGVDTDLPVGELSALLRGIEDANGRVRSGPKFAPRTLDIDILTYGNACGEIDGVQLPREEVLRNAFVLRPLADIAPNDRHPETVRTFLDHWEAYDQSRQKLWPIHFPLASDPE